MGGASKMGRRRRRRRRRRRTRRRSCRRAPRAAAGSQVHHGRFVGGRRAPRRLCPPPLSAWPTAPLCPPPRILPLFHSLFLSLLITTPRHPPLAILCPPPSEAVDPAAVRLSRLRCGPPLACSVGPVCGLTPSRQAQAAPQGRRLEQGILASWRVLAFPLGGPRPRGATQQQQQQQEEEEEEEEEDEEVDEDEEFE